MVELTSLLKVEEIGGSQFMWVSCEETLRSMLRNGGEGGGIGIVADVLCFD
jgi:hypothetical protein